MLVFYLIVMAGSGSVEFSFPLIADWAHLVVGVLFVLLEGLNLTM